MSSERLASFSNGLKQTQTHEQTLGVVLVILQKRGKKTVGVRVVKDTTRKPTESYNLGSVGFTEAEPKTRQPAWG